MNPEVEEIISAVKDLNFCSIIKYFTAIWGPLASILTLVGSSLSGVFTKLLDIENRKTVKYVICNRIRNYTYNLVSAALGSLYLKLFYYLLFPLIYFAFLIILLSSLDNYMFMILTQIALIIVSRFVAKRFNRSENPNYRITALFFPLVAVFQTYLLSSNYEFFLSITVILGFVIIDCVILVLVYAHKKNKAVLWFAIPRHIILYLVLYLLLYSDIQNTILTVGAIIWGVLIIIEFPIHIITAADIIPVAIHTVEGVKTTRSRIMQYECSKIMYKLEDGTIEVVDEDTILYMSCITPARFYSIIYKIFNLIKYKRFRKYSSVECLFNGKELEEIQTYEIVDYKYIKESWIRIEVRNEDYKSDIIVNANRVKKIVSQNKKTLSSTSGP